MLYKNTVSSATMEMIHKVMKDPVLKDFFLVGGTSLSLRLGHRKSDDIDLFSTVKFEPKELESHFDREYDPDWVFPKSHGVTITCGRENIDLWYYPVPIVNKPEVIENIRMLSIEDVGAMKVNSIALEPVRPKDFMDIYQLLEKISLEQITKVYQKKYPDLPANEHAKTIANVDNVKTKKLILFDQKVTWEKIEKRMQQAVLFPKKIFGKGPHRGKGMGL